MFPIPINEKPFYNTDAIANGIAANDMWDCYLEPVPGVGFVTRRRPGLLPFSNVNTGMPGDGIFWWDAAQLCVAVSGGRIFTLSQSGAVNEITGAPCIPGVPVVFSDGQQLNCTPFLYMASGKLIYSINGAQTVAPTDPLTPPATHVDWIDSRFIANFPGTPRFAATDTNPLTLLLDNTYWSSTINPFRNTAKGDNIVALKVSWEEIYAMGSLGCEVWQDDFVTPFSTIPSAQMEIGLEAKYSVGRTESTFFALCVLDGERCVIKMVGRQPVIISDPISNLLSSMPTVSDAIGDLISVGGCSLYMLSFPSANQTWVYDHRHDTWCRWGYYNGDADNRDRFIGQHVCFCKPWNMVLCQSRIDGSIYQMSRSALDDAGTEMLPYRRTGWVKPSAVPAGGFMAMSTDHRKRLQQLYIKGKPGLPGAGTLLLMRYRDDGRNEWSTWTELSFTTEMVECLTRQGTFRTRQWEFRFPSGCDTVLVSAEGSAAELKN